MNEINRIQKGWECPKCGAVMAPHVSCCVNCRGNNGGGTAITITKSIPTEVSWTGNVPLTTPSSTCVSKETAEEQWAEEQWEQYYLNL